MTTGRRNTVETNASDNGSMDDLRGFRVAVTANRLVREQTLLFERLGAVVVPLPLVRLELTPEDETLTVINRVLHDEPQIGVFSTGLGVRWLFAIADSAGVGDELRSTLDRGYVVARGPKARGALTAAGLHVDWMAPGATGAEVIEHLRELPHRDDQLFVQLDGVTEELARHASRAAGLRARTYTCLPCDAGLDALASLADVHAITFTSPVAVAGLRSAAGDRLSEVVDRLAQLTVVAVGPVTGAALHRLGVTNVSTPREHRLGAMVRTAAAALAAQTVVLADDIQLRGSAIVIGDEPTTLSPGEHRLLVALIDASGSVVTKRSLARKAGVGSDDPHAVEAIVTRLRRRLGPAAQLIETVPRRGYRLAGSGVSAAS
jgi:uroporphyrinogen-III synthase